MSKRRLIFDIEANGLFPSVDTIHCICAKNVDTGQEHRWNSQKPGDLEWGLNYLAGADLLIAHNLIGYDKPAIEKIHPWWKTDAHLEDTLVLSGLLYPHLQEVDWGMGDRCKVPKGLKGKHKLEAWGHRLGLLKGKFEKTEEALAQWSQELEDYCMRDVEVLEKLWHHLKAQVTEDLEDAVDLEHQLQEIITHQELHGFLFDIPKAQQLYAKLQVRKEELLGELQEQFPPKVILGGVYKRHQEEALTLVSSRVASAQVAITLEGEPPDLGDTAIREWLQEKGIKFKKDCVIAFNPNSEQQVTERFKALGWKPTAYTDKGNVKMDEEVIEKLVANFPEAKGLGEYVMVNKRLSQLGDGKGAWLKKVWPDGRMHGGHNPNGTVTFRFKHFNPNMSQVPACDKPYGKECRELFHVPEGFKLVGCDVSGEQLRMLAHYLARWDGGAYAREVAEGDIHTRNMTAAGLDDRDTAKTFIYAFLFGAGDGKLGSIVGGGIPAGKRLRARFLKKTPALHRLFNGVRAKAGRTKKLRALDGRTLHVRSAHSALNYLIQSAGAVVVKRATVIFRQLMESQGWPMGDACWSLVAHSHDEFQTECLEIDAKRVASTAVTSIVVAGEYYNLRCPLTGEAKIGNNWAETH